MQPDTVQTCTGLPCSAQIGLGGCPPIQIGTQLGVSEGMHVFVSVPVYVAHACNTSSNADLSSTSLTDLALDGCTQLEQLPQLPGSIKEVSIIDASALLGLPNLPEGLNTLGLTSCTLLQVRIRHGRFATCRCNGQATAAVNGDGGWHEELHP